MMSAPATDAVPAALEVIVEDPEWDRQGDDWNGLFRTLYEGVMEHLRHAAPGAVVLLLTDDSRLAELNARFRGKDAPTNVLAFPAPPRTGMLGDVAIAYGVCAREAAEQNKDFAAHAAHLILHGMLHLHGLDHETGEEDARAMEALERVILAGIGVADPYAGEEARHDHD